MFIMYFSAAHRSYPGHHCIGYAWADEVAGPYRPYFGAPLICPDPDVSSNFADAIHPSPGMGGAIDAAGFRDFDGSFYVVYKLDGNSMNKDGPCGNGGSTRHPTPFFLIQVGSDGYSPVE